MTEVQQSAAATAADKPDTHQSGNSRRRKLGIGALVTLGSTMLCVAIFATWVDRIALDSQTWSDTSTEALQQPAVQTAVANYLVDQLYSNVNVPALLAQALPARAQPLAGPIAAGAEPYIERAVAAGLARPHTVQIWRLANLHAHQQLMNVLNGGSGPVSTAHGTVSLDLTPLVGQLSSTISQRTNGAVALPPNAGNITLLKSDQLRQAQDGVKLLRLLSLPLALAALAVLAIAVAISRDRRRTLRAVAIGILAAGVVLILIRRVVGDALINSLTTLPDARAAGHAIWWVATDSLGNANITTVTVGLLLLIGTWFAGPGRRATELRHGITPYLREPAIAYGVYAAIVLLLLIWAPVNAAREPSTAIILIVLGAIGVEALRRLVIREFPDHTERDLGHRMTHRLEEGWAELRRSGGKPAPQPPAAPAATGDRYADLERLAQLHERGVLDDREFAAEKSALLAGRK